MSPRSSAMARAEQQRRRPALKALSSPAPRATTYKICIQDLNLSARIGLYAAERDSPQPLRLSLTLEASPPQDSFRTPKDIVCYKTIIQGIEALLEQGHVDLLEQLADKIAAFCLTLPQARTLRIRLEKPKAIKQTERVGIELRYYCRDG